MQKKTNGFVGRWEKITTDRKSERGVLKEIIACLGENRTVRLKTETDFNFQLKDRVDNTNRPL